MSVLFASIRWLKIHYLACRCLLKGEWTTDSSCHECSVWWGVCCEKDHDRVTELNSLLWTTLLAICNQEKIIYCLIATLEYLQSHPKLDMPQNIIYFLDESLMFRWWSLNLSFVFCYHKNNASTRSLYSFIFKIKVNCTLFGFVCRVGEYEEAVFLSVLLCMFVVHNML